VSARLAACSATFRKRSVDLYQCNEPASLQHCPEAGKGGGPEAGKGGGDVRLSLWTRTMARAVGGALVAAMDHGCGRRAARSGSAGRRRIGAPDTRSDPGTFCSAGRNTTKRSPLDASGGIAVVAEPDQIQIRAFELEATGRDEVQRIAKDLGLPMSELGLLISRDSRQADLLHRRLAILKLDANALADREPLLFRDLQRVCTLCDRRRPCVRDLARDSRRDPAEAAAQRWRDYCPNGATLNMLSTLEICSPAQR
jgi:hypothetical protein